MLGVPRKCQNLITISSKGSDYGLYKASKEKVLKDYQISVSLLGMPAKKDHATQ